MISNLRNKYFRFLAPIQYIPFAVKYTPFAAIHCTRDIPTNLVFIRTGRYITSEMRWFVIGRWYYFSKFFLFSKKRRSFERIPGIWDPPHSSQKHKNMKRFYLGRKYYGDEPLEVSKILQAYQRGLLLHVRVMLLPHFISCITLSTTPIGLTSEATNRTL